MGLWGTYVVARAARSLLDLVSLTDRCEGLDDELVIGGWRIGLFGGGELSDAGPDLQTELAAESAGPVLTGFEMDSDTVDVEGFSASTGYWRSCLDRESMRGYCRELDDAEFAACYLDPPAATAKALAWARDAGLTPDPDAVRAAFEDDGDFHDLLAALGLGDGAAGTALPVPPRVEPASRPLAGSNRFDALIRDHASGPLAEAGFVRIGRRFRSSWPGRFPVRLEFTPSASHVTGRVELALHFEVVPDSWRDWECRGRPEGADDTWIFALLRQRIDAPAGLGRRRQVRLSGMSDPELAKLLNASFEADAPSRPELSDRWHFDPGLGVGGPVLTRTLRGDALSRMRALSTPATLLDATVDRRQLLDHRDPDQLRLFALLDDGPSAPLARAWSRLARAGRLWPDFDAWAPARLRDRFGSDPSWRDQVLPAPPEPAAEALADVVGRRLAPVLIGAGFEQFRHGFRRRNEFGDLLVIEPAPAYSATGQRLVFRVDAAVLPAGQLDWLRHDGRPVDDGTGQGWCWQRIEPPAEHLYRDGGADLLDLGLWQADDVERCGAALADRVGDRLAELVDLLDRDRLTALVTDPDLPVTRRLRAGSQGYCRILLGLDREPDDVLLDRITAAADEGRVESTERGFLAWARSRVEHRGGATVLT